MKNPPIVILRLSILAILFLFAVPVHAQVTITCPADISADNDPGLCEAVVTYTEPIGTGTGTNITTTLTGGLPSGASFPVGTTVVEYTVTNDEGDVDVCSFNVTVNDIESPVIDCPPDIIVDANAGACTQIVNFSIPTATDNCGPVTVTQFGGLPSGSAFPVGENFLDFQVTDGAGNNDFCRVIVFVNDVNDPEIICPADITVNVETACDTIVNYTPPIGSDLCGPAVTSQIGGLGSGSSFPVGTTVETYQVQDQFGTTAICSFNITVVDVAPPVFDNCPSDILQVAPPPNCEDIVIFSTPTASDNCPGVTVVQTQGLPSGSLFPVGISTIEFTATDAAGNSATCTFDITISEDTDPEITCPSDIVVDTDPGACDAVVTYTPPTGTDNCPNPSTILIAGLGPGATFPIGTTTETYEVTDEAGNTATCSFTVTVEDNEAPVIDCPSDIIVPADPGLCETTVTFSDPTFTENCPGGTITQTGGPVSGSVFPVGPTPIEFTAEDAAGNQTICAFNIIVEDDQSPTITCPADIVLTILSGACDTTITYSDPTFSDNCPGAVLNLISGPSSGSTLNAGDYTVQYEVVDASGNTATCSFDISIEETSNPVFDCPADLIVNAGPGDCEAVVNFTTPTATDSCSSVTITQTAGPISGSTFPAGSTTVEFTAEDESGNTALCSFNIIVVDDSDPEITCPADIIVSNDPAVCGATVIYDPPTTSDNCGVQSVNLIAGLPSGDVFPVGSTTVTFEVEDISGNTAQCSFDVTVNDEESPIIVCPNDTIITLPIGNCDQIVNYTTPTATDNCGVASITLISGPASGDVFSTGTTDVTFEALDDIGNSTVCTFTVTLLDQVDPEITCPADIVVSAEADLCGATVNYTPPVGTDDCAVESTVLSSGLGSGSFFPVGTTIEEYTVTDISGNTATCTFTITVEDDEGPVLDCPSDIVVQTEPGVCEAVVNFTAPTANDNCDGAVVPGQVAGLPSGSAFPGGTTVISFEAVDVAGNVSTCSFNIIVEDVEDPIIDCPDDIVVNAGPDCSTIVNFPDATATDNCGVASIVQIAGPISGTAFPAGVTIVTFEAVDDAGNSVTCSFNVTVFEDEPPTITCPEDITTNAEPGICGAVVTYEAPIASDDCGEVTVSLIEGLSSGSEFPVGSTTVTFEAEDFSGNTTTCSFTVEVVDAEPPVFTCPETVTLENDPGICGAVFSFDVPNAIDNCPGDIDIVQTGGPISGSEFPVGTSTLSFEATDEAGNTATCSYEVIVEDLESPVFEDCLEDIIITLEPNVCDSLVTFTVPTATDNCGATVAQTEGPVPGTSLSPGVYTIVFTATDDATNESSCSFSITVEDVTPPFVDCPETFVSCDIIVELPLPIAADSCGIASIVQTVGPESGSVFPIGISSVEFEITDINGNIAICNYDVEVLAQTTRPEAGPDQNNCDATSTTLSGNTPEFGTGLWFIIEGEGEIASPNSPITQVNQLGSGINTFVWSIDPENGCEILTDTISVFVETGVIVDAGPDQNIILGGDANITAFVTPPDGSVEWSPPDGLDCTDCLDPIASPGETTQYFITYTTPLGCVQTDSITIKVFIEIPNTITPDGDGVNDTWNIPEIEDYPDVFVQIFNRWGNEVFSSAGYNEPWDGRRDGEELPAGSYYYIIDYNQSGKENLNGTVNIIR